MKKLKGRYEVNLLDENTMQWVMVDMQEVETIDALNCIVSTKKAQYIQIKPDMVDELIQIVRFIQGMVK